MEPEVQAKPTQAAPEKTKSYIPNWDNFYQKALEILASQPVRGRFTLKYNPKTLTTILKITDGKRIVMKKCNVSKDLPKVEKFAELAVQVMTNQAPKKKEVAEEKDHHHKGKDKKKKEKKGNK